jgi:hypothetical protein
MNDWTKPRRHADRQGFLFRVPVDELLARLRVSRDDARRWNCLGWLSYDVDIKLPEIDAIRFQDRSD